MKEKWYFEHDDLECDKCRTNRGAFNLNFYVGTHLGREAEKYSCSNEDCGYEEIKYIDEMFVNEDGSVQKANKIDIGQKITLSDGHTKRILKQDKKGLYVIKGGIKNYVTFHSHTNTYQMTGEWAHKE